MKLPGICAFALALVSCSPGGPQADRIFINGKVWTGDDDQPLAEAMAIAGDTIIAVGTSDQVSALASDQTEVVDLNNRLIVPGFQDSHIHLLSGAVVQLDLAGAESIEEIQRRILEFAQANPDIDWITGRGWGYSAFPEQVPHKNYLDQVVDDRPVYLRARDGHMGLGNSLALELAGISRDTPDPARGRIVRDAHGEPTGELQEAAQRLVRRDIPPPNADQLYNRLIRAMDTAAAVGLTSVHDAGTGLDSLPVYERALEEGTLKIRFHFSPRMATGASPSPESLARYVEARDRLRGPELRLGTIKGGLDGTIDAQTAAMFEPYVGGGTGIPFWEQDALNETVAVYDREGFQVILHAIGDKAISMALNAFEYAATTNSTTGRRHRVEHAEMPLLSDLKRFKDLGVIASTQPMFANPDATVLENFAVLLGPERARHADSFSIYDDAGVVQVFGSDFPVMTLDVLKGIEVAVTRMTASGNPPGGWYPDGRISVDAALRHYTVDAAYGTFSEDIRGELTAGKLADFVVLSRDILEIPSTEISETRVLLTVMGGKDTYRSEGF